MGAQLPQPTFDQETKFYVLGRRCLLLPFVGRSDVTGGHTRGRQTSPRLPPKAPTKRHMPAPTSRLDPRTAIHARPDSRQRDPHADWLKAAAIFGVVCIHAGVPYHAVFRFGVPVFLGLWAFYVERALARRTGAAQWTYLRARLFEVAIPYLAWTLLYIGVNHLENWSVTALRTVVNGWFGGYGWSGQYFFIVLIQFLLLTPLLRRLITPATALPIIIASTAFSIAWDQWSFFSHWAHVVGGRLFFSWIPYVAMGIALARGMLDGKPAFLVAASVTLLAAAAFEASVPYLAATIPVASLLLLLATVVADRSALRASHGLWATAAAALGRRTLPVFLANPLMIDLLQRAGFGAFARSVAGSLGPLLVAVAALAGALILGWLLTRVGLGVLVASRTGPVDGYNPGLLRV
ncbi:MAG: acyltransferase [Comamonadaceae bacterium]|nr:MAG: acyltransferase [Comamonadaceae bacterium]